MAQTTVECNPGDVTNKCKICYAIPWEDRVSGQLAYNQILKALQQSGYSPEKILKQAQEAYKIAALKYRYQWLNYNDIFACSQCTPDAGRKETTGNINTLDSNNIPIVDPLKVENIYDSAEATSMRIHQCKQCEDELIPNSKPLRYKAKWVGGVDPKSCDTCEQQKNNKGEKIGVLVTDGKCKEKTKNRVDSRYSWVATYIDGECDCVRRCDKCKSCEKCAKTRTKIGHEECKSKCEQGSSYVCSELDDGCVCKFTPWVENPNYDPPFQMCPVDKPTVKIIPGPTLKEYSCECECECTSKTNFVCATADKKFLGCKCKYVTEEQMSNLLRPGPTDYFSQATVCKGNILAADDGGCTCCDGSGFQAQGITHDCLVGWFFDEPTCKCKLCPTPCVGSNVRASDSCDCICPISEPGGEGCPQSSPVLDSTLCECECPTSVIMSCSSVPRRRFDSATCSCVYDIDALSILLEP
jgi:hypothetical protein